MFFLAMIFFRSFSHSQNPMLTSHSTIYRPRAIYLPAAASPSGNPAAPDPDTDHCTSSDVRDHTVPVAPLQSLTRERFTVTARPCFPTSPTDDIDMLASFPPSAVSIGHAAVPRPDSPVGKRVPGPAARFALSKALAPEPFLFETVRAAQQIAVLLQSNALPGQEDALKELFRRLMLALQNGTAAPSPPPSLPASSTRGSTVTVARVGCGPRFRRTRAPPHRIDNHPPTAPRTFEEAAGRAAGKLQTSAKSLRRTVLLRQLLRAGDPNARNALLL